MVKNAGSKNKRGRLMKNMKSPNSGLIAFLMIVRIQNFIPQVKVTSLALAFDLPTQSGTYLHTYVHMYSIISAHAKWYIFTYICTHVQYNILYRVFTILGL